MGRQDDGIVIVAENNEKMFISHVTIQCSAFLEKLIVNQLVKRLPALYVNQKAQFPLS